MAGVADKENQCPLSWDWEAYVDRFLRAGADVWAAQCAGDEENLRSAESYVDHVLGLDSSSRRYGSSLDEHMIQMKEETKDLHALLSQLDSQSHRLSESWGLTCRPRGSSPNCSRKTSLNSSRVSLSSTKAPAASQYPTPGASCVPPLFLDSQETANDLNEHDSESGRSFAAGKTLQRKENWVVGTLPSLLFSQEENFSILRSEDDDEGHGHLHTPCAQPLMPEMDVRTCQEERTSDEEGDGQEASENHFDDHTEEEVIEAQDWRVPWVCDCETLCDCLGKLKCADEKARSAEGDVQTQSSAGTVGRAGHRSLPRASFESKAGAGLSLTLMDEREAVTMRGLIPFACKKEKTIQRWALDETTQCSDGRDPLKPDLVDAKNVGSADEADEKQDNTPDGDLTDCVLATGCPAQELDETDEEYDLEAIQRLENEALRARQQNDASRPKSGDRHEGGEEVTGTGLDDTGEEEYVSETDEEVIDALSGLVLASECDRNVQQTDFSQKHERQRVSLVSGDAAGSCSRVGKRAPPTSDVMMRRGACVTVSHVIDLTTENDDGAGSESDDSDEDAAVKFGKILKTRLMASDNPRSDHCFADVSAVTLGLGHSQQNPCAASEKSEAGETEDMVKGESDSSIKGQETEIETRKQVRRTKAEAAGTATARKSVRKLYPVMSKSISEIESDLAEEGERRELDPGRGRGSPRKSVEDRVTGAQTRRRTQARTCGADSRGSDQSQVDSLEEEAAEELIMENEESEAEAEGEDLSGVGAFRTCYAWQSRELQEMERELNETGASITCHQLTAAQELALDAAFRKTYPMPGGPRRRHETAAALRQWFRNRRMFFNHAGTRSLPEKIIPSVAKAKMKSWLIFRRK